MAHTMPSELLSGCDSGFFYCLAEWANTVTGGYFWIIIIMAFMVVLYLATMRFGSQRAFGFSSIVGLLASVWMAIMGLLAWWIASVFIIIGLIGIAGLLIKE